MLIRICLPLADAGQGSWEYTPSQSCVRPCHVAQTMGGGISGTRRLEKKTVSNILAQILRNSTSLPLEGTRGGEQTMRS